jgi:hypothetical protein
VEKIESAKEVEEFKKMQDMLQPLNKEQERRDKIQKTMIS